MPATVEKKVTVRARHEEAIIEFRAWLIANPKASFKRKVKQFDLFMDAAYFRSQLSDPG